MTLKEIRSKYPQYNDLSDDELLQGLHKKFYSDMAYGEFASKVGGQNIAEEVSEQVDVNDSGKVPYGEASLSETVENFPESAKGVYEGYKHMIMHPAQTANTMGSGVLGGIENIAESMGWERPENLSDVGKSSQEGKHQELADAMGEYFKERGGSWKAIKETVKTDPAGAFLDILGVTSVGGGALRAVPGMAKVGKGVQKVAAAMDPVNIAVAGVKAPYRLGQKHIPKGLKEATTGAIGNLFPRHEFRSGKALNELAGEKAPELIKNMEYQAELMPGSRPTAIQAALQGGRLGPEGMGPPTPPVVRPQFASLDKPMQRRKPMMHEEVKDAQRVARLKSIETNIAKTPAERKVLVKARSDVAGPMYTTARNDPTPVDIQPALDKINKLLEDNPRRDVVQKLFTKMRNKFTDVVEIDGKKQRVATTNAKEVISGIEGFKDIFKKRGKTLDKDIKMMLQEVKLELIDDVPLYKAADANYREMSRPINQIDIGRDILKKITNEKRVGAIEGQSQFLTAIDEAERTIKNSLGDPRYKTLHEILDPKQMEVLDLAKKEINRDAVIAAHGQKGSNRMEEQLKTALGPPELPGMLSTKMMVARNFMSRLKGHATKGTMDYIADRQFSGPEFARLMKKATPEERAVFDSSDDFRNMVNRTLINQAIFQSGRLGQENQ